MDQIAKTTAESVKLIARNEPVYAKDSPLANAKAVQGLRAVFGEASSTRLSHLANHF